MVAPDDSREETIRCLFPLVKKIGRRISRMVKGADVDDLIGEGSIGLIRAVDSFDPKRGPSLEQYAGHIIAGAMLNGIRRLDPVSERVRRDIREAEREQYALATQRGELPSMHEMEERRPGLARARMHAYRYTPLSLDGPLPAGENFSTNWYSDPGRIVDRENSFTDVRAALKKLPPRQRRVLVMHYFGNDSLHTVGRKLSISPQRASQLHLAALANLRRTALA
ncbi:MAG: sigma-70 family RNA polymerase sigma factor [Candidatus Eremiobacteraeota bacterium]|nr:sigma-70 family RNA polymerase sigma factor [Candidatus Eremiobacteraeota bacterium]